MCGKVCYGNNAEAIHLARFATAQHERDGFLWLGRCFLEDIGCERDLNLAKQNLLIAAELGDVFAAVDYGCLRGESDPARWIWWERAALRAVVELIRFLIFFGTS